MAYDQLSYETIELERDTLQTLFDSQSAHVAKQADELDRLHARYDKLDNRNISLDRDRANLLDEVVRAQAECERQRQAADWFAAERDNLKNKYENMCDTLRARVEEGEKLLAGYAGELNKVREERDYLKGCAIKDAEIIYQREKTIDELRTQLARYEPVNGAATVCPYAIIDTLKKDCEELLGNNSALMNRVEELEAMKETHTRFWEYKLKKVYEERDELRTQLAESEAERLKGMDYMRMQEKRMRTAENELAAANEKLEAQDDELVQHKDEIDTLLEMVKHADQRLAALQPPAPTIAELIIKGLEEAIEHFENKK